MKLAIPTSSLTMMPSNGSASMHQRPTTTPCPLTNSQAPSPLTPPCMTTLHSYLRTPALNYLPAFSIMNLITPKQYAPPHLRTSPRQPPYSCVMQEHQSTRRVMSPDPLLRAGEHWYLDHVSEAPSRPSTPAFTAATYTTNPLCAPPPLSPTGITPIMNVPIVEAYTTCPLSAQSSSLKHMIICHTSRHLLSQYPQSLRRDHSSLPNIWNAWSSPYQGGLGSLSLS